MKKRFIPLLFVLTLGLTGCNTDAPSSEEYEAPGDGYVDVLPTDIADGVIFHAFNWTFNQISENLEAIYDAGFRTIQTSPIQQPKSGGTKWEFFYQPVSFAIAVDSPLGTKSELTSLCSAAKEKGMSIIVDIVFNHMATPGVNESSATPPVDKEVETYEPYIYQHQEECFHHVSDAPGSGKVTQVYPGLPDLNTANKHVQERALSLLKECIDVGIDGFRFDAAKHIETPDDPNYASDFWPETLGKAKEYYKEKNPDKELFAYGEILNDTDGGRNVSCYTKYMKVTDNTYISDINSYFVGKKAEKAVNANYGKDTTASNLVTWVESHDTYTTTTSHIGDKKVFRQWSLIAARKDTQSLFFARVDDNATVAKVASYMFEDEHIGVANRFHNRFVHADEYISGAGAVYINEKVGTNASGAYIVDASTVAETLEVNLPHIADGYYFDQINGKQYHVVDHKVNIEFDNVGVVILTPSKNKVRATYEPSVRSGGYVSTFDLKIKVSNASSASYKVDNGEEVAFTNEATIKIGQGKVDGDITKVVVKFSNGDVSSVRTLTYKKVELVSGGFNVLNFKAQYMTDYEVYIWTWGKSSLWTQNYEYNSERSVLVIKDTDGLKGFLVALFEKGHVITELNKWDESCVKQTADMHPNDLYFDAINF